MKTKLQAGKSYDTATLVLVGWTAGDGSGSEGYSVENFFDANGKYLGADAHGIEPIFENCARLVNNV